MGATQQALLMAAPPAGGGGGSDPYWSFVTLLILGNNSPAAGGTGSNTFIDESTLANTISISGSQTNSTDQIYEGTGSVHFNGGGLEIASGLATAWDFGGGDFCLEAWIYGTSGGSDRHIFDAWGSRFLARHSGTDVQFGPNYSFGLLSYTKSWATGGWHHYAWARNGNDWGAWYDGVSEATATNSGTISSTAIRLRISGPAAGDTVPGYGDGIRITKGHSRYTPGVGFTPPTTFPTS